MTEKELRTAFGTEAIYSGKWTTSGAEPDHPDYAPDSLPDDTPFPGAVLTYVFHDSTEEGGGSEYSEELDSPTYREVLQFMDRAMDATGDHHHRWFEGFDRSQLSKGIVKIQSGS